MAFLHITVRHDRAHVYNLVRTSTYGVFCEYNYEKKHFNRTEPEAEAGAGSAPVSAEHPGGRGFL